MRCQKQIETQRLERLDRYRKLFVEEWRRQRITNVDMACRLGRSLSLVNKLKKGSTPLTGPIIDQFIRILGIDPIRAMFAVDIAQSHMSYFDPKFQSACTTAISFFDQVAVEFGYGEGWVDLPPSDNVAVNHVDLSARAAAATLASSFVRPQPTGHGFS